MKLRIAVLGCPKVAKKSVFAFRLAEDPTDKNAVISLYVTKNGVVSGNKMTGMAAEVLKRIMNTPTTQKQ